MSTSEDVEKMDTEVSDSRGGSSESDQGLNPGQTSTPKGILKTSKELALASASTSSSTTFIKKRLSMNSQ